MNNCQFFGNLTHDPELRVINGDRKVVKFGMAVNRRYTTSSGEKKEQTTFLDLEAWGTTAELINSYFKKGDLILITSSEYHLDTWEKNGEKRSRPIFRVKEFLFPPRGKKAKPAEQEAEGANNDESVPF